MLEKKPSGQRFKEHRAARWMKRIFDLADGLRTSRCALDGKDLKDFDLADG